MREILFKAKRVDSGEWVFGFPYRGDNSEYCDMMIEFDGENCCISGEERYIDPKTLCQYTGLRDRNGESVFEGDLLFSDDLKIIRIEDGQDTGRRISKKIEIGFYDYGVLKIKIRKAGERICRFEKSSFTGIWSAKQISMYKITGNIHDNTETYTGVSQ